jgi:hypothetical protein
LGLSHSRGYCGEASHPRGLLTNSLKDVKTRKRLCVIAITLLTYIPEQRQRTRTSNSYLNPTIPLSRDKKFVLKPQGHYRWFCKTQILTKHSAVPRVMVVSSTAVKSSLRRTEPLFPGFSFTKKAGQRWPRFHPRNIPRLAYSWGRDLVMGCIADRLFVSLYIDVSSRLVVTRSGDGCCRHKRGSTHDTTNEIYNNGNGLSYVV